MLHRLHNENSLFPSDAALEHIPLWQPALLVNHCFQSGVPMFTPGPSCPMHYETLTPHSSSMLLQTSFVKFHNTSFRICHPNMQIHRIQVVTETANKNVNLWFFNSLSPSSHMFIHIPYSFTLGTAPYLLQKVTSRRLNNYGAGILNGTHKWIWDSATCSYLQL
jgi:hypothetical protein